MCSIEKKIIGPGNPPNPVSEGITTIHMKINEIFLFPKSCAFDFQGLKYFCKELDFFFFSGIQDLQWNPSEKIFFDKITEIPPIIY